MTLTSPATTRILLLLAFAFAAVFVLSAWQSRNSGGEAWHGFECDFGGRVGREESVSREVFPMEGDVAWIVQISDLHLSAHHPERGDDLRMLLPPALRAIQPSLVLITGNITDAKSKDRTSSRQDEMEWVQYRDTIDAIVTESCMDKRRFFDTRGNHDKYGVPCVGSKLDFFSAYSISSQMNRLSTVQSISLVGSDQRYLFVGIDDTMEIGIRGPSHLFGHPTDERIDAVELELQCSDRNSHGHVTKTVFGHFPLSFITSTERGKRYEAVFAQQSVSTYLCGHLHAKFGQQLWRKHSVVLASDEFEKPKKHKQFWEWELGDWKESRIMRILAIDAGEVSFLDVKLSKMAGEQNDFKTAILITHPLDSRSMNLIEKESQMMRNDISALVFTMASVHNVTAKVFDSSRGFKLIEEIQLHLVNSTASHQSLFRSKWNPETYRSASATQYWMQVFVLDIDGEEAASTARPFSVEGKSANIRITWMAYLIFYIEWETLYWILVWSNMVFLFLMLLLPKIAIHFMEVNTLYQEWVLSVSFSLTNRHRRIIFSMLWFFIKGSANKLLWSSMAFYLLYLLGLPWFWGHAVSENGTVAKMFMFGWSLEPHFCPIKSTLFGFPDVMAITVPFMYLVVSPLFLLIYGLVAEQSAYRLHNNGKLSCLTETVHIKMRSGETQSPISSAFSEKIEGKLASRCSICRGRTRSIILLACSFILCAHYKQSSLLIGAYGIIPVLLSPAICWVPPLLMGAAVYSTRSPTRNMGFTWLNI